VYRVFQNPCKHYTKMRKANCADCSIYGAQVRLQYTLPAANYNLSLPGAFERGPLIEFMLTSFDNQINCPLNATSPAMAAARVWKSPVGSKLQVWRPCRATEVLRKIFASFCGSGKRVHLYIVKWSCSFYKSVYNLAMFCAYQILLPCCCLQAMLHWRGVLLSYKSLKGAMNLNVRAEIV